MKIVKAGKVADYFGMFPREVELRTYTDNDTALIEINREDYERYLIADEPVGHCYICGGRSELHEITYKERGIELHTAVHADCLRDRIEEYPMDQQAKGFAKYIASKKQEEKDNA